MRCVAQESGVTFLSPNKKVTKEVGIGEAFMTRCRAPNAPSPMYLSRANRIAAQNLNDLSFQIQYLNDGGGCRSPRPAEFD